MQIFIQNIDVFKSKILSWISQFDVCCFLDSNNFDDQYSKFDLIIGVDTFHFLDIKNTNNTFQQISDFKSKHSKQWIFGGFSYDLKNEIENLSSNNEDELNFPEAFFFVPKHLLKLKGNKLEIVSENANEIWNAIDNTAISIQYHSKKIEIKARFDKQTYIKTVKQIQHEIAIGNIYETNFCMEFYSDKASINPISTYQKLNKISPTPFSNYFKWFDKHIISATPERFLSKRESKLISQPIKGTAKRGLNIDEDKKIKKDLLSHPKERQENVMIVDLVRNDLTKSAIKGTVKVEELFGIYSFKQVHQMISTVVCELNPKISSVLAIKNSFPMGSMTGAPKIKAMQLMEHFEKTKRGMYSGATGYFSPDDDFDFNVIIRTILYNESKKYLSFHVGSAITYFAEAEKEYEECLLKVKAIFEVLEED